MSEAEDGRFDHLNKSREQLVKECEEEGFRSGGPGGQRADRRETGVRLTHEPTGITVRATDHRHREENKQTALRRLRRQLAAERRHPIDPNRLRVPGSLREYVDNGLRVNPKNPHAPFLIKLVLDLLEACDYQVGTVGDHLEVPTNQVVRFLKDHDLLEVVNQQRKARDLGPLK